MADNPSFETEGASPGEAEDWARTYDTGSEEFATFSPLPEEGILAVETYDRGWSGNGDSVLAFTESGLEYALFDDSGGPVERYRYAWKSPNLLVDIELLGGDNTGFLPGQLYRDKTTGSRGLCLELDSTDSVHFQHVDLVNPGSRGFGMGRMHTPAIQSVLAELDYGYQDIGPGDGQRHQFGETLTGIPIHTQTLSLTVTIAGVEYTITDDGSGLLECDADPDIFYAGATQSIDYTTGVVNVRFTTAPDDSVGLICRWDYGPDVTKDSGASGPLPYIDGVPVYYRQPPYNHNALEEFMPGDALFAEFDVADVLFEDYEDEWDDNEEAVWWFEGAPDLPAGQLYGTYTTAAFDTVTESAEDYEEEWSDNQLAQTTFSASDIVFAQCVTETVSSSTDHSFTAGTKTITRAAGSFTADGFATDDIIVIAGTANNDGTYTVDTIGTTTMTVDETIVDEATVVSTITKYEEVETYEEDWVETLQGY